MSAPTLLVLAAGMGSRYGGLKQVVPVNAAGDTIVDYSAFDAVRAGFGEVVFVIRKEIEQAFKATIGTRFEQRMSVAYAFQELDSLPPGFAVPQGRTKPWGTLHATVIGGGADRWAVCRDQLRRLLRRGELSRAVAAPAK